VKIQFSLGSPWFWSSYPSRTITRQPARPANSQPTHRLLLFDLYTISHLHESPKNLSISSTPPRSRLAWLTLPPCHRRHSIPATSAISPDEARWRTIFSTFAPGSKSNNIRYTQDGRNRIRSNADNTESKVPCTAHAGQGDA
jgi:hypothetical protein